MSRLVVGVDGSPGSVAALRWAAEEAALRRAPIVVLHAYRRASGHAWRGANRDDVEKAHRLAGEEAVTRAVDELGAALADVAVEQQVLPAHAAQALVSAVDADDLLVVGTRGTGGFHGLLLGGTAEHCARQAPCPVVVVGERLPRGTGRIVVGVDGSTRSHAALEWAVAEADLRGAEVDVVCVYLPYRASGPFGAEFMEVASPGWERRFHQRSQQTAEDAIAAVHPPGDLTCTARVGVGHAASVLVELAKDANLLVVGNRGLGGFSGVLLGSVSREVLHHASCPVVIVHG